MERKLASIQKIDKLENIEGADFILKARIMGWDVIVKKDEFAVGDKCCFFEVDSILPDGQVWSEFMRARKFRIRTAKMRGVLSQGLVLPLSILPPGDYNLEDDVTEVLGITKYEIPQQHSGGFNLGKSAGNFPHYVPKTDEIRIQSCLQCLDELRGCPYYITLKCDGTSSTFSKYRGEFLASSRNWAKKKDDESVYWKMVHKYDLTNKVPEGFAIQGEVIGPGIQYNRLMLTDIDLRVFTIYDIEARRRVEFQQLVYMCKDLGLPMVPVLEEGGAFDYTLDQLLEMAKGKYEGTSNHREGIVIRPQINMYSQKLQGPLSFKCINNDYLLKYGE